MQTNVMKSIALWGIARDLQLPYAHLERMSELTYLRQLLEQLKIDCVLDVGANVGQFASELRGIGYRGQIVSFEPIASVFAALKGRFANDPQWRGFHMALGSAEQSMTITIPKLTVLSSLLEPNVSEPGARRETVVVTRLDQVLPGLQRELGVSRVFLKMDTQGYDLEVFRGASGCVDRIQGIQSELSVQPLYKNMPHYLESLQAYELAGFELYNLSVVNRVETGGLFELNCFMRRRV
jgi:FkbM family methyltransferase